MNNYDEIKKYMITAIFIVMSLLIMMMIFHFGFIG